MQFISTGSSVAPLAVFYVTIFFTNMTGGYSMSQNTLNKQAKNFIRHLGRESFFGLY